MDNEGRCDLVERILPLLCLATLCQDLNNDHSRIFDLLNFKVCMQKITSLFTIRLRDLLQSMVFPEEIPMGQDRRIRPL
jgi:hypothetical protein